MKRRFGATLCCLRCPLFEFLGFSSASVSFRCPGAACLFLGAALLARLAAGWFCARRAAGRLAVTASQFGRAAIGDCDGCFRRRVFRATAATGFRCCEHCRGFSVPFVSRRHTAGAAFGTAFLAFRATIGLAPGLTAGLSSLAAAELRRTAIFRFWFGGERRQQKAESDDRSEEQSFQHEMSLQQMFVWKIRTDCARHERSSKTA
jgi:hypothetical protein